MNRSRVVAALAISLLAGSCGSSGPSLGHEGRVQLTYLDGWGTCTHDCSLAVPLGVGADALIEVANADDLPALTARSSDPSVLEVSRTPSSSILLLSAGAEGSAELELADDTGAPFDSFTIEVRPIARVVLASSVASPIRLVDEPVELAFDTYDASGTRLRGFGGVTYEPTPNLAVERQSLADRIAPLVDVHAGDTGTNDERIFVGGDLSGTQGTLLAHPTVGAPLALTFDVVGPIIDSMVVSRVYADDGWFVTARIELANLELGLVACCAWELDPSDPTLYLTERECARVRVATTDPTVTQRGTVWCRSHGAEASVDVELPLP
jgi:hypothetical protein